MRKGRKTGKLIELLFVIFTAISLSIPLVHLFYNSTDELYTAAFLSSKNLFEIFLMTEYFSELFVIVLTAVSTSQGQCHHLNITDENAKLKT